MASNLPVIRARTSEDNIIKMKFIAKCNGQSLSKEIGYIIEQHIAQFEKEHGEIKIPGNEVET